jgi:hypothetical protein
MKSTRTFALALAVVFAVGCVPETEEPTEPTDTVSTDEGSSKTTTRRTAALETAVPEDGARVSGEFLLGAIVDGEGPMEVRFMLDGREVAVVNDAPYQLSFDGCELTEGNHAYVVEVADTDGNRDYVEQWFTVEACQ